MWNLLKNTFRSLAKNKISIIGLTFLIFLSVGMFTVLQSTSTNINTTYKKISREGNQHDFTVSEHYNTGNITQQPGDQQGGHYGLSSDGEQVYWPDQTASGDKYTKTYYFHLYADASDDSLVGTFYNKHKDETSGVAHDLIYRSYTITNSNHLTYMDGASGTPPKSTKTAKQISEELIGTEGNSDSKDITAYFASWTNDLLNYLEQENSPLNQYLTSDEMKDEVYFRNYSSLNINNSTDGIFYDVVLSQPEDETHPYDSIVDREILFDNSDFNYIGWHNFSDSEWKPYENRSGLSTVDLLKHTFKKWDDVVGDTNEQNIVRDQIELLSKGSVGSVSNGSPSQTFINQVNHLNNVLLENPDNFSAAKNKYEALYNEKWVNNDVVNKKYSYVVSYETSSATPIPFTWLINNWTSDFMICAPQYMQAHGLVPLDIHKLISSDKDYLEWSEVHSDIKDERTRFIGWMNSLKQDVADEKLSNWMNDNPNNLIKIAGATPTFILSAGITGDYVYPVVSISRPIPNTEKECVVFGNKAFYERVHSSFLGNEEEKYVVGKFYNPKNGQKILNEINAKCKTIMSWPENINAAYMATDLSCTLNAAAFRISYIPQLVNKIDIITYLLTIFVITISLVISVIIVRRYVSNSRTTIGVIQANGVKKWNIALSLTPFALIPSLIGGISGYLLGTFLQKPAISLFSNFWTLPTGVLAFSWLSIFVAVLLPFLLFVAVSIFSTYLLLREKTTDLMKSGSEYKFSQIAKLVKKPFKRAGVISKFRVSIAFSSMWKLFVLSIMSSLIMSSLTFGFTINGKFDQAITKTLDTKNYSYSVDLYTPTEQGGQYIPVDGEHLGLTGWQTSASNAETNFFPNLLYKSGFVSNDTSWNYIDSKNCDTSLYTKTYYQTTFTSVSLAHLHPLNIGWICEPFQYDEKNSYANMFVPFMSDAVGQKTDLNYLKNRYATKLTLNYVIGLFSLVSNPWSITASLMPENLKNICNTKYEAIINEIGNLCYTNNEWKRYKKYFARVGDAEHYQYKITDKTIDYTGMALDRNFLGLINKIYQSPELLPSAQDDYEMVYNAVPLTNKEETYTYVNGDVDSTTRGSKPTNVKVLGVYNNSKFVNLIDENNKNLASLINYENIKPDATIFPMLINQTVAKKYNYHVGTELSISIANTSNRFTKVIKNDNSKTIYKFKVVGIVKSCEDDEFYIDQQIANWVLGLKSKYREGLESSTYCLNNNYIDYSKAIHSTFSVDDGLKASASLIDAVKGDSNNKNSLQTVLGTDKGYNIIPYGFNGYFTKDPNGSKGLVGGISFYSPSGIWCPSATLSSNTTLDLFKYGANLELANELSGINDESIKEAYDKWQSSKSKADHEQFTNLANGLLKQISTIFGDSSYVSLVTNAMDKNAKASVYGKMAETVTSVETIVLIIIVMMVFFIVLLMSSIIIADCKKLAAILSSLGYTDMENALSFMAIYIPVILLGLAIGIPLTLGFATMFQVAILNGIGLLVDTATKWYWFVSSVCIVSAELILSIIFSWISLRKTSLVSMIK